MADQNGAAAVSEAEAAPVQVRSSGLLACFSAVSGGRGGGAWGGVSSGTAVASGTLRGKTGRCFFFLGLLRTRF